MNGSLQVAAPLCAVQPPGRVEGDEIANLQRENDTLTEEVRHLLETLDGRDKAEAERLTEAQLPLLSDLSDAEDHNDRLKSEVDDLASEVELLTDLIEANERSLKLSQATCRDWQDMCRDARGEADAWREMYRAAKCAGPAALLIAGVTAVVAAGAGFLFALAQFAT